VFDIVRLMRSVVWNEPFPFDARVDFDGDGRLSASDLDANVDQLALAADPPRKAGPGRITVDNVGGRADLRGRLENRDTEGLDGRITDIAFSGETAEAILHTSVPFTQLRRVAQAVAADPLRCPREIGDQHGVLSGTTTYDAAVYRAGVRQHPSATLGRTW
jgi:hypothetical protein